MFHQEPNGIDPLKKLSEELHQLAERFAERKVTLHEVMDVLGVRTIIHTDIGTDGMMTGPNLPAQEAMLRIGQFRVIASGGVSRREDVIALAKLAQGHANLDGVIVGKALYEKRVELRDLLTLARG